MQMEVVILASFVLIGVVCGFFVSIFGFLAIICVWLATIASAIYVGVITADLSFFGFVIAMALAQTGFLASAMVSNKLRALNLKLSSSGGARGVEPNGNKL